MFEDVPLDTWEEYIEKLGEYSRDIKYLSVINMILTRRNLKNCFQYSNAFISEQTGSLIETVEAIDAIQFRPLQQMFVSEDCCIGCSSCSQEWRLRFPWTGSILVNVTDFSPEKKGCAKNPYKNGTVKILTSSTSKWLYESTDPSFSMIVYKHSNDEIRLNISGYKDFEKYSIVKNTTELQRVTLFFRYLCSSGRNSIFAEGSLYETDPYLEILKTDDWKTTPSMLWSNKIESLDNKISSIVLNRQESIKIISTKFKEQIESCGGLINFMEQYYPRTNLRTLAAMCCIGEQPA